MTVLADADECEVNRFRREDVADALCDSFGISLAVQQVITSDSNSIDEPVEQIAPKTGAMREGQADVLVEMEHLHARPVDAGSRRQRLEEVDL